MNVKRTLIVPIKVHASYQAFDSAVVGSEMDFESFPYCDTQREQDVNPDFPYLAESIIPRPADVHHNWDFPPFMKRTKFRASNPTKPPSVPTRWLLSRYTPQERKLDSQ